MEIKPNPFQPIRPIKDEEGNNKHADQKPWDEKATSIAKEALSNIEKAPASKFIEGHEELSDLKIKKMILQMEPDDPFIDTDLVIFKDEYTGHLPLNGIKESDFIAIKKFYEDFINGNTKFSVQNDTQKENFKELVNECVKRLLTRKAGREILYSVQNSNDIKNISLYYCQEVKESKLEDDEAKKTIYFNPDPDTGKWAYFSINPKGKRIERIIAYEPPFITLGHEVLHVTHGDKYPGPPTASLTSNQKPEKRFDDLEEQVTITGIIEPIHFQEDATELENLSDEFFENWETPATISKYEELNEANLLAAFKLTPKGGSPNGTAI